MSRPLLHVTCALKAAGLISERNHQELPFERGNAVHAATHYLDEGDLDAGSVDPVVEPYLIAYARYLAEVQPKYSAYERYMTDEHAGFQGTCDRIVSINDGPEGVLDIKTGSEERWHALQLAAYSWMAFRGLSLSRKRWNLYLRGDETYRLVQVESAQHDDLRVFQHALGVANWLVAAGAWKIRKSDGRLERG